MSPDDPRDPPVAEWFVEYRRTAKGDGPTVLNAKLDKIKAVAAGWS